MVTTEWTGVGLTAWINVRLDQKERFAQGLPGRSSPWRQRDALQRLREVEAVRTILARHSDDSGQCAACHVVWPCTEVRLIAVIWRHHETYDPDWAPEPVSA